MSATLEAVVREAWDSAYPEHIEYRWDTVTGKSYILITDEPPTYYTMEQVNVELLMSERSIVETLDQTIHRLLRWHREPANRMTGWAELLPAVDAMTYLA